MVASRCPYRLPLAASVSLPTSASVRYSRVRNSAFGRRSGVTTFRFSVLGATNLRREFAMEIISYGSATVRIIIQKRTVAKSIFEAFPREPLAAIAVWIWPHGSAHMEKHTRHEIWIMAIGT